MWRYERLGASGLDGAAGGGAASARRMRNLFSTNANRSDRLRMKRTRSLEEDCTRHHSQLIPPPSHGKL